MIHPLYITFMLTADFPNNQQTNSFHNFIKEGRLFAALNEAVKQAQNFGKDPILASQWYKCAACIAYLVGNDTEAHKYFKRSLKEVSEKNIKYYVNYFSAMTAITNSDALGAAKAFSKMADEKADDSKRRVGLAGLALLYLFLADIQTASLYSELLIKESSNSYAWYCLGNLIIVEISLMQKWKSSPIFSDHLYWYKDESILKFESAISETARLMDKDSAPFLLATRYRQLVHIETESATHSISNAFYQLNWGERDLASFYLTNLRIEQSLSIIHRRQWKMLGQVMKVFEKNKTDHSIYQMIQIYYCLNKFHTQQGETEKGTIAYKNYLKLAAKKIRLNAEVISISGLSFAKSSTTFRDEISARLPAKYRRAYQYMQANIFRNDLSIEDVAASIKVTTRALQVAFKNYLGESPAQVLRKIRLEHVHNDLLNTSAKESIMDVANKYGISNRTSMINQYRRIYSKLPSSTLRYGMAIEPSL